MGAPKTHVWEETGIKPGDTIKLIDKLTPEERAAVRKIRELGDTKVLDIKASFLEEAAASARAHANAAKILDHNPWLETVGYEPKPYWPGWAIATAVTMLAVALLAIAVRIHSPTLPPPAAERASADAPEGPIEALRSRKGRGDPPPPEPIAK